MVVVVQDNLDMPFFGILRPAVEADDDDDDELKLDVKPSLIAAVYLSHVSAIVNPT